MMLNNNSPSNQQPREQLEDANAIKMPPLPARRAILGQQKSPLEPTTTRTSSERTTRAKTKHRSRRHPMSPQLPLPLIAIACLMLAALGGQAAVVRPTIFSDLNSAADSQQQQFSQQQQQGQQQQAGLSPNGSPIVAADGPLQTPSTKITPYKSRFCTALNGARTDAPLGLQSLQIDDLALSASSYSNEQVGPHLARLNLDISGGAWCPVKPISGSNFGKEWIQVKLNRSFVVSAIETQGRFGMGNGKEFTPSYQVEYSRNGGLTWHKWKNFRGSSLLPANDDVNKAVKNELSPPIVGANVIRILPYSQHLRTVCLRFELHGCPYDEGAPVAYATKDGVVEPRWGHLIDYTYDGLRKHGQLSQGLGQLVDGVKGPDNFSHNSGFEWVGWKSMNGDVEIEFAFKTVRNFTGALFHSNNLFSSGVEVFQGVDVHYGLDVQLAADALKDALQEQRRRTAILRQQQASSAAGASNADLQQQQQQDVLVAAGGGGSTTLWSADVLSIEYEPDKKLESSRPVTVHLKQRLANRLKFVLKFASKWILVSEVEFLSHPVELLSLASLSEQYSPQLIQALAPAKAYDEYVAILREHQLRRIATSAYLESFAGAASSAMNSIGAASPASGGDASDQPTPDLSAPSSSTTTPQAADLFSSQQPNVGDESANPITFVGGGANSRHVAGPLIPAPSPTNQPSWPDLLGNGANSQQQMQPFGPSTNPLLNPPMVPFIPLGQQLDNSFNQQQQQQQQLAALDSPYSISNSNNRVRGEHSATSNSNGESSRPRPQSTTIGLATVVSFGLAAVLVLLGALFVVSSYRLRHQPKLGGLGSSPLGRVHFAGASKSGGPNGGLPSFMSVFSSAVGGGATNSALSGSTLSPVIANETSVRRPNEYNPVSNNLLFASPSEQERAASTLRRLASLTGGGVHQKGSHPLLQQGHQQQPGQLLVSTGKAGNQPVSTQLIVGLNQANPLAQQQIYNNSSNMNCSNQTYATHYSTSMSIASSSTNGHQGEYADYAIPDAQPIIPPLLQHQGFAAHHNQHQQHPRQQTLHFNHHLNHAFNTSSQSAHNQQQKQQQQQQFKQPFGYQTEMRASHRQHHQQNPHQATLIQPQVVHQQRLVPEHNYELILQDQQQQQLAGQQAMHPSHTRTLSSQLSGSAANCGASNSHSFDPMNFSNQKQATNSGTKITTARVDASCNSSGGDESSPIGPTTTTSSLANSSSSSNSGGAGGANAVNDLGGLSRYYYSPSSAVANESSRGQNH